MVWRNNIIQQEALCLALQKIQNLALKNPKDVFDQIYLEDDKMADI